MGVDLIDRIAAITFGGRKGGGSSCCWGGGRWLFRIETKGSCLTMRYTQKERERGGRGEGGSDA